MVLGWGNKVKKLMKSIGGAIKTGGKGVAKVLKNPNARNLISKFTKLVTGFDPDDLLKNGAEFLDSSIDLVDEGYDTIQNINNEDAGANLSEYLGRMSNSISNIADNAKDIRDSWRNRSSNNSNSSLSQLTNRLSNTNVNINQLSNSLNNRSLSNTMPSISSSRKILGSKNKAENNLNSLIKLNDEKPGINLTYGDVEDYNQNDLSDIL
jgi:hypothetical protein